MVPTVIQLSNMTAEEEERHYSEDFDWEELPDISDGAFKDGENEQHKEKVLPDVSSIAIDKGGSITTTVSPKESPKNVPSVDVVSVQEQDQSLERVSASEASSPIYDGENISIQVCFNDEAFLVEFETVAEDSDPEFYKIGPDILPHEKHKPSVKVPLKIKQRSLKCPENAKFIFKKDTSKVLELDKITKKLFKLKECYVPLDNLKHSQNTRELKKYKVRSIERLLRRYQRRTSKKASLSEDYVNACVVKEVEVCPKQKEKKHSSKMHKSSRHDSTKKHGSSRECDSSKHSSKNGNDSSKHSNVKENQHRKTRFDYDSYKVHSCKIKNCKKDEFCIYYHSALDRRRDTRKYTYTPVLCKEINLKKLSKCPKGDNCNLSHSDVEMKYHPWFYKKIPCKKFLEGRCPKGDFCVDDHKAALMKNCEAGCLPGLLKKENGRTFNRQKTSELLDPTESKNRPGIKPAVQEPSSSSAPEKECSRVGNLLDFEEENEEEYKMSSFVNACNVNFDYSPRCWNGSNGINEQEEPASGGESLKLFNQTSGNYRNSSVEDESLIFGRGKTETYIVNKYSGQNLDTKPKVLKCFDRMMKVKEFLRMGLGEKMTLWFSKIKKMEPDLSGKPFVYNLATEDNGVLIKKIVADLYGLRNMDYPSYIIADVREALNMAKILYKNINAVNHKFRYYGLDLDLIAKSTVGKDLGYIIKHIENEIAKENGKVNNHIVMMLCKKVMERQHKMKCRSLENILEHQKGKAQSVGITGTQDHTQGLQLSRDLTKGAVCQPIQNELTNCNAAMENCWQNGATCPIEDAEGQSTFSLDPLLADWEEEGSSHMSRFVGASNNGVGVTEEHEALISKYLHSNQQWQSYARLEGVNIPENYHTELDVGSSEQAMPQAVSCGNSMGLTLVNGTSPHASAVSCEPPSPANEPGHKEVLPGIDIDEIFKATEQLTEPETCEYIKNLSMYLGLDFDIHLITSICRQVTQIRHRKAKETSCSANSHSLKNGINGVSNAESVRKLSDDLEELFPSTPPFAGKSSGSDSDSIGSPKPDLAIPLLFPSSSLNVSTERKTRPSHGNSYWSVRHGDSRKLKNQSREVQMQSLCNPYPEELSGKDLLRGMEWEMLEEISSIKEEGSSQRLLSRIPPSPEYTVKSPEYTCKSPEVRIISPTYSPKPKRRLSSPENLPRSLKSRRRITSPEYSPKPYKSERLSPVYITQKTDVRRTTIEYVVIPSSPEYDGD